jgi:Family of unknown function (DUF5677)
MSTATAQPQKLVLSRDEYHLKILENVKALKARLDLPSFLPSDKERDKALRYFVQRACQIGEACFRISDLQMPLFALARILCEDFIRMYWATLSEQNAAEYSKAALSEMAKMLKLNLKNNRARVRHISTGKDVTDTFLPNIDNRIIETKSIKQMAEDSGLSKVYDVVFRFNSLEVHGNTLGLTEPQPMDGVVVALSAVNAFLRVTVLVADSEVPLTAEEVLGALNMRSIPGT